MMKAAAARRNHFVRGSPPFRGRDPRLDNEGDNTHTHIAVHEESGGQDLDLLLHRLRVEVVPVTEEQAETARSAYRRFGKEKHPAGLNFGNRFSYALARSLGEPLLFVGQDFGKTDVSVVEY